MNIQNIQSMSQNVDKTYGMLNELDSNGLELMDLAIPNHDGVQDQKVVGELLYLRQCVNSLKRADDVIDEFIEKYGHGRMYVLQDEIVTR